MSCRKPRRCARRPASGGTWTRLRVQARVRMRTRLGQGRIVRHRLQPRSEDGAKVAVTWWAVKVETTA